MALAALQNAHDQYTIAAGSVEPNHDVEVVDEWIHHNDRLHAKAIKKVTLSMTTSPAKKSSNLPNYVLNLFFKFILRSVGSKNRCPRPRSSCRALVSLDAKGSTGFVNESAASSGIVVENTVGETRTSSTQMDFGAFAEIIACNPCCHQYKSLMVIRPSGQWFMLSSRRG